MKKKHPGFKAVQNKIAHNLEKKGESSKAAKKSAGAILSNASRHASPAAKKANSHLKRVKGK